MTALALPSEKRSVRFEAEQHPACRLHDARLYSDVLRHRMTSRNARSSGQLTYSELAPPATYIKSTACTALLTA